MPRGPANWRISAVALTFDDGPDPGLEAFLRTLEGHGARATFFVVGEQVERDPGRLREIVARGHEVAVHCHRHRNHLRLNPRQTAEDMRRAKTIIEEKVTRSTRLFRPSYGVFNLASWIEAQQLGWERVLWRRWGRDWEARATALVYSRSDRPPGGWRHPYAARLRPVRCPRLLAQHFGSLAHRTGADLRLGLRARPVGELSGTGECC